MTVHTHGPEDGPGLQCPESLVGACVVAGWRARVAALEQERDALRESLQATMEFCILQEHADIVRAALTPPPLE